MEELRREPKLKGQVALVTGAGCGLGRAFAHRLSTLGARVAVLDLSLKSFADYAAEREAMEGDSTVSEIEGARRGGDRVRSRRHRLRRGKPSGGADR